MKHLKVIKTTSYGEIMQHLAMIMDGNRRWAREKKLQAVTLGHKKGVDAIRSAITFCLKKRVKYLSLYTFSLENFKRNQAEKTYIFDLLADVLRDDLLDLIKHGVRVRFVGERSLFPEKTRMIIEEVEGRTKDLNRLCLNMLFCYGSKQEILSATKRLAQQVKEGSVDADQIDENLLRREMWLGDVPDPDLILRTGKRTRLSNFLLFQGAYSEWMFLDYHWPEINEERLQECVDRFQGVERNFGC